MSPVGDKTAFFLLLLALACFVFAAFRNGIGKTKTDFVALGLALWVGILMWNAGASAW